MRHKGIPRLILVRFRTRDNQICKVLRAPVCLFISRFKHLFFTLTTM